MTLGYIIASHQVTNDGKPIGYLYRENPDNGVSPHAGREAM